MNEFERWYKVFEPQIDPDDYDVDDMIKIVARRAWKRALEWVQSVEKEATDEHRDKSYGRLESSIAIEEELKDE